MMDFYYYWQFIKPHLIIRREFWLPIISTFLFFAVADSVTTYLGVCIYTGFEMNSYAIRMASAYGYLPFTLYNISVITPFGYLLAWMADRASRKNNFVLAVMIIVFFSLIALDYGKTIIYNTNTLALQTTGNELIENANQLVSIPTNVEQLQEHFQVVENRMDFCRLI